ncbi:MAG: DegT/DnrJ/EryC1/StrS family aminotransferase [Puniceicoccales bacterium]|jgi:dTDP-4-amino-4,6-dideoxygalactose transaminase|nr:DegT/DnrJ/EryC1/StrS family aminotransferase [Puniceicoccales bacterium]
MHLSPIPPHARVRIVATSRRRAAGDIFLEKHWRKWIFATVKIPLFDPSIQNSKIRSDAIGKFSEIFDSGEFILGKDVELFEGNVARYLGVKHAIGMSSGTDTLLVALMALGIGHGDEVICPSFTFFAAAGCIARVGAKPVFADINLDDFTVSTDDILEKITDKTKAIIPVHLFGQLADMDAIAEIGHRFNLPIVEDCAQSFGALRNGRQSGTLGTIGSFSFYPTKNLGGFGDAGLVCTNDDDLAEKMRIMRVHGMAPKYFHRYIGGNFRIDTLQAALLNLKLPHVDGDIANRRRNAEIYSDELADVESIVLPVEAPGNFHTWHQFTVRILGGLRGEALKFLLENDIGCGVYYPLPLDAQECFRPFVDGRRMAKNAAIAANEVISLPIYPSLSDAQIRHVASTLRKFFAKNA